MPTYDYECLKCGYRFEKFQNINAKPIKECPKCGKSVRRLIGSGAGIIFSRSWRDSALVEKGTGFYATDYKKSSGEGKEKKSEPTPPM